MEQKVENIPYSTSHYRYKIYFPSLRKFKFDHGFREYPMRIYSLGLTRASRALQQLKLLYNHIFVSSARFPLFVTDALQKIYERQRYRESRYTYVKDELHMR